jgi:hypothetical protein
MGQGSSAATEAEILHVTCELLAAISRKDWTAYSRLCHPALTCFEPEASGHLVRYVALRHHASSSCCSTSLSLPSWSGY